jgi:hypothetical protein
VSHDSALGAYFFDLKLFEHFAGVVKAKSGGVEVGVA